MQVTINEAAQNLLKLIEAAMAGEEVVILKGRRPVARLTPIVQRPRRRFKMGILEGRAIGPGPDFLEPMSEEDLALWEGRG